MSLLGSLFGKATGKATAKGKGAAAAPQPGSKAATLPAPKQPVFVIGDLHGRLDLLERMLELIDHEIGTNKLANPRLVFVGNLIDRGPASAQVVQRMRELTTEFPDNVLCLMGNHEQMCLDFLDAPVARHARWLKDGAMQTFASYGLPLGEGGLDNDTAQAAADALREALGPDTIAWMQARPLMTSSGTLHVVHAAADPRRDLNDQTPRVLTWGHPEFIGVTRGDGQWVAHGHTVFERPHLKDSRISVDTGAWETGVLSAAMILPDGQVGFVQATL